MNLFQRILTISVFSLLTLILLIGCKTTTVPISTTAAQTTTETTTVTPPVNVPTPTNTLTVPAPTTKTETPIDERYRIKIADEAFLAQIDKQADEMRGAP